MKSIVPATNPAMMATIMVAIIGVTEIDPENHCRRIDKVVKIPNVKNAFFRVR